MDYPNDFDIPSFSAGKTIAFSRSVSVWISIVFFLIIVACGFIILGRHLKTNYPFLISIDPITDEWSVVTYPGERKEKIPQYQIIQEKLVKDYVTDWFTISGNSETNEKRWKSCTLDECSDDEFCTTDECTYSSQFKPGNIDCAIACKSGPVLFDSFEKNVLPQYRMWSSNGAERWNVGPMLITPQTKPTEDSSKWQVITDITSNIRGTFKVLCFIDIKRNSNEYPSTLGYYVDDFNAYRITNE